MVMIMTENKRFHLVKCYNEQWGIVDTSLEEIDQLVLITTSKSGTGYIVNVLNALHEDLEKEKQKNRALKTVLGCTKMRLKKICEELE